MRIKFSVNNIPFNKIILFINSFNTSSIVNKIPNSDQKSIFNKNKIIKMN